MILDLTVLQRFTPISLAAAAVNGLRTSADAPMVTALPYLPQERVEIPAISYGITSLEGRRLNQHPPDAGMAPSPYSVGPIPRYVIRDAVVHGRYGFVTSGTHLFTDFLDHIPLHLLPGVGPAEDGSWTFPAPRPRATLGDAMHLLFPNLENYYHWNFDTLGRFDPALCQAEPAQTTPVLLVPQPTETWQRQTLALLPTAATPVMRLDHTAQLAVERLVSVPLLSHAGFHPHPGMLRPFHAWRDRLAPHATMPPSRRIYISRQDSTQRRLRNEADIIETVVAAGYEVVSLTGMDVADQVRLFSESSHIIAPHGAGLTNIIFCRPGARLLELHMDSYVQWIFRRLAGVAGVTYGCLIGTTAEEWAEWPHANSWTLDPAALAATLRDF